MWERRSPLCPHHVTDLTNQGFKVLVQPCNKRVFTNREYQEAGAIVQDDLSEAGLVIGVKQIQTKMLTGERNFLFFSHTIKAQPGNMAMLDHILKEKCRLFDYECITRNGSDTEPRLVAFGKYAGIAGMIDGLQGLGQRLLAEGYSTPFLNVPTSHMYQNLDHARYTIRNVGAQIENGGIPDGLTPLVFGFTGAGNVSQGAQSIFTLLPHEFIKPEELPHLKEMILSGKKKANKLYGVVFSAEHMVKKKDGSPLTDKRHYYDNAEEYVGRFHEDYMPYVSFLANCMYWDFHFPRLITKQQIKDLRASGNKNLRFISDISCDPGGSIEFLSKCTPIDSPFYHYIPETGKDIDHLTADGVGMLSVEILPTELPRDASEHFGQALMPLLPPLLKSAGSSTPTDLDDLPAEMKRACIASHGELLPKWRYISRLRQQKSSLSHSEEVVASLYLSGHLFDSGLINSVLDELEGFPDIKFSLSNLDVRPNASSHAVKSRVEIQITGSKERVKEVCDHLTSIAEGVSAADADVTADTSTKSTSSSSAEIRVMSPRRVLLLGSGRVCAPVVKMLGEHENIHVTIASDVESQARDLMSHMHPSRCSFASLRMPDDDNKLDQLVHATDIVISLLPATMHAKVAEHAIKHKSDMVTASYVSPDMRKLDERVKAAGITILNEVGLDPGIDHMMIMKAVDEIHSRGGVVEELTSLCGGLPDPVAADNPLRYKFSWSPKGVLSAAQNPARYLLNGELIEVPGADLLKSGRPSPRFPTMRLEALPNRDSMVYRDLYGISQARSICRGTLRYEGWSNAMYALKALNLFDPTNVSCSSWAELITKVVPTSSAKSMDDALAGYLKEKGVYDVPAAMEAIHWLGLLDNKPLDAGSALDALCGLLESKLQFSDSEKDMVAMFHSVVGRMPDGTVEEHTSRLLAFGIPGGDTAMAATVGYTTAAATELVLFGKLNKPGVLIPITSDVYNPLLDRIQTAGITWTENVSKV